MRIEYWWNDTDRGNPKYARGEKNPLSKCRCAHHKYHKHWLGLNLDLRGETTLTNSLSTT
jgi:hypothetical protein